MFQKTVFVRYIASGGNFYFSQGAAEKKNRDGGKKTERLQNRRTEENINHRDGRRI